ALEHLVCESSPHESLQRLQKVALIVALNVQRCPRGSNERSSYKEFWQRRQESSTLVQATFLTQPQEGPDKNAASDGKIGNFTEITKSSYRSTTEDAAEPEPASLGQGSGASLPPGVVFSIEDPSKSQAAPAEAVPSVPPTADL